MRTTFRRMNVYHPRRSSKALKVNKQRLSDLETIMKDDLESLLLILQNGSKEQVDSLSKRTQDNLQQIGPDMERLAQEIGAPFPKAVHSFLDSISKVLHAQKTNTPSPFYLWVDDSKVKNCHLATAKLEKILNKQSCLKRAAA